MLHVSETGASTGVLMRQTGPQMDSDNGNDARDPSVLHSGFEKVAAFSPGSFLHQDTALCDLSATGSNCRCRGHGHLPRLLYRGFERAMIRSSLCFASVIDGF